MAHSYNKGEWSELYAFLSVLANGKMYGADENLEKDPNIKYHIISASQSGNEYFRNTSASSVDFNFGNESHTVPISDFYAEVDKLFEGIKNGSGRSFELPAIEPFIERLKINSLKAGSRSKGDLVIKAHDALTSTDPIISFSVKSHIGSPPTLLNASDGTKIKFSLSLPKDGLTNDDIEEINNINSSSKIKDRIAKIYQKNAELKYESISSETFTKNLQMIDYRMPELLAKLFEESYSVRGKKIPDVVDSFILKTDEDKEIIEYKVKQLLIACALGMVPLTPWHGLDEATGGYMIVKDNSDVLCYHIYDRNKLSEYLYRHTAFDTPSSSRYDIGKIFSDDSTGELKFELNLQIRI
ncbi:HpaII family restriction endonuclease [Exiguobacterium indicum]|uniref:HpaII family restriction endonuclease n=1 Tax=Exiguobacterium indicum TaxID=296995 RepID=UPI002B25A336|nr:HpaII family restriction endonuclease [Exiguobacterium indicum]